MADVRSYKEANEVHIRFSGEWPGMTEDEKLRWLVAAAGNGQVAGEGFKAGVFFQAQKRALKNRLTQEWLFDNDKDSHLHDWSSNPVGAAVAPRKKRRNKRAGGRSA